MDLLSSFIIPFSVSFWKSACCMWAYYWINFFFVENGIIYDILVLFRMWRVSIIIIITYFMYMIIDTCVWGTLSVTKIFRSVSCFYSLITLFPTWNFNNKLPFFGINPFFMMWTMPFKVIENKSFLFLTFYYCIWSTW